jgi:hypothetical protein
LFFSSSFLKLITFLSLTANIEAWFPTITWDVWKSSVTFLSVCFIPFSSLFYFISFLFFCIFTLLFYLILHPCFYTTTANYYIAYS